MNRIIHLLLKSISILTKRSLWRDLKLIACVFTFATVFAYSVYGQTSSGNYPVVNIISPTASSLGKYVDFPVSMHTGVPDISIPIYTVKEGPLELPVSLSYHASGLKVQETASWVGAGWTLNAGGVVSRTVKGLPDEQIGFDGNYSYLKSFGYSSYFIDPADVWDNYKFDYPSFLAGTKDGEPDLFFFNFAGYSGKFYFRENRVPMLIPEGDFKIEPQFKGPLESITYGSYDYLEGFIITVPNGTKFYFGVTKDNSTDVDPVEKSGNNMQTCSNMTGFSYDKVYSSWYLNRVESPDGKSIIELIYRAEEYAHYGYSTSPSLDCSAEVYLNKTLVEGVALDQIRFSNGTVTFIPSAAPREDVSRYTAGFAESANIDAKSLAEIKIQSTTLSHCRTFKLNQSYFVNNSPIPTKFAGYQSITSDKKRLKLNSIQEFSCDNQTNVPPFVFSYHDETAVPRRLSFSQDHWGFINGAENDGLSPSIPGFSGDDNREAQWPQMRAGTLRTIQYPTGGGTEFIYEPNQVKTSQCTFTQGSLAFTVIAGMGVYTAEDVTVTRNEDAPVVYYYKVQGMTQGSGDFYIDNVKICSVVAGQTIENYIQLTSGVHTLRAHANPDQYGGSGVMISMYATNANCQYSDKLVGGLRIKRIEQFGIDRTPRIVKSYEYNDGVLYSVPVYAFKLKNEVLRITGFGSSAPGDPNYGCLINPPSVYYSAASFQPMQTSQGYHIGYTSVKEIMPDGGYTVNQFNGNPELPNNWITLEDVCVRKVDNNLCKAGDPVYPTAPLPFDYGRGSIKARLIYDKFNNKLSETLYTQVYQENKAGIFGLTVSIYPPTQLHLPNHYEIRTAKLVSQSEINRIFNPTNPLQFVETQKTTELGSQFHRLPTRIVQTVNDGTTEEKSRYAPDITICNYECPSCAEDFQNQVEILKAQLEQNISACRAGIFTGCGSYKGCGTVAASQCGDTSNCTMCSWTNFQYYLNERRKDYQACILACKNTSNACLTAGKASANPDGSTLFKLEDKNQIDHPIETSSWKNNQLLKASYFDFQTIDDDPLEINLKKVYITELSAPASTFNWVTFNNNILVRDSRYSSTQEVTYQYDQGRIVEITGKDGVKTSYIWGFNNTVPIVKAVGIDRNSLLTAYNSNPANIRNHALMVNAKITTYQYDPLVGIVSILDPNEKNQLYEYDLLGRLLRIKDHNGKVLEQFEYQYGN